MITDLLKPLGMILFAGISIYLAMLLSVYFNQSNLIHLPNLPSRQVNATPQFIGLAYEEVVLTTEDGLSLNGWFLPNARPRATLLFHHGNAGNISHRLDSLRIFHELDLAVLIFDYRGYGKSEGSPDEAGLYRDTEAAWSYLTRIRGIPGDEILLFGRSLGGSVAAYLAERHDALGLILESTFTSVPDMAAELYPWLPVRRLSKFDYDNRSRISKILMPLLVIHSPEDEIIPFSQALELFDLARDPKWFLSLQGDHNGGFLQSSDRYIDGLNRFIDDCIARRDAGLKLNRPVD